MLNTGFESVLLNLKSDDILEFFLWVILFLFAGALISRLAGWFRRFVIAAPSLLTSLGILGTFAGIVVGLLGFDTQDIDGSIGTLLAGLKTAFVTSLAGMGSAILFKIISVFVPERREERVEGAGPDDILRALLKHNDCLDEIKSAIAGNEETSLAGQVKLLRADQGDRHRQLLGSIDSNREDFKEFSEVLWKQMHDFGEMLSKSATEQVINALKEVITDFNKNLTEQFGENFKALDESVKKLVDWQEHYRIQMNNTLALYKRGVKAIQSTESSLSKIAEDSGRIPETMDRLREVVEVNQHQIQELESHLEAFQTMRDKAVEAVPFIQSNVEQMVANIGASVTHATEHHEKLLEQSDAYITKHTQQSAELLQEFGRVSEEGMLSFRNGLDQNVKLIKNALELGVQELSSSLDRISTGLETTAQTVTTHSERVLENLNKTTTEVDAAIYRMTETLKTESSGIVNTLKEAGAQVQRDAKANQEQFAKSLRDMQQRFESSLEELSRMQIRSIEQMIEGMSGEMQKAVSRTGEGVNAQLEAIDKSMNQEIERVMNGMGKALAQIAGKFTEDYKRLTEAMDKIVRTGRVVQ